jgi:1-phosphatidylinositol-4-phosphate 5-kinase
LKNLNLIDYSLLVVKVNWIMPPKNPLFWGYYQRIQSSVNNNEFYHIGVIDYLQQWDLQKKGEKWWKKLLGKKGISAQEPKKYQHRFVTFVSEITEHFT